MAVINLNVNGKKQVVDVDPKTPMLWILRDHLNLVALNTGAELQRAEHVLYTSRILPFAPASYPFHRQKTKRLQPSKGFPKMEIIPFRKHGSNTMCPNVAIARRVRS